MKLKTGLILSAIFVGLCLMAWAAVQLSKGDTLNSPVGIVGLALTAGAATLLNRKPSKAAQEAATQDEKKIANTPASAIAQSVPGVQQAADNARDSADDSAREAIQRFASGGTSGASDPAVPGRDNSGGG